MSDIQSILSSAISYVPDGIAQKDLDDDHELVRPKVLQLFWNYILGDIQQVQILLILFCQKQLTIFLIYFVCTTWQEN